MHIEGLKIFCDLVDTQSFAKTAAHHGITQSAVSQQIKTMEHQMRQVLLERRKYGLALTAAGELFNQYAQSIVRSYDLMQNEIDALHGVISGTIRLACIYSFGMEELGPYVRIFLKAYPGVRLLLAYDTSRHIFEKIAQDDADLGIATALRSLKNIVNIPFRQDALGVVFSAKNPLAKRGESLPVDALGKMPFIAFEEGSHTREALDRLFYKYKVYPHVVMALNHISMVKHAVEEDLGIAILPLCAVKNEIEMGTLVVRRLNGIELFRPLSLLYRADRRLPVNMQKMIEILKKHIA